MNAGVPTSASPGVRRTAHIDLAVVVANARARAADLGADLSACTADLRADAYGHGLTSVARALDAVGIGALLVSRTEDAGAAAGVAAHAAILNSDDTGIATAASPAGTGHLIDSHALFGLEPSANTRPAMRLTGEVIAVKRVPADRGVSYGYTYRTRKPTTLALVALGFADGIPRVASNRAPVRIGDFTGRVTGRVAMDQFVVDLDGSPASVGDTVVLFGDPSRGEPTVADWAEVVRISADAIVSRLGARIERIYTA